MHRVLGWLIIAIVGAAVKRLYGQADADNFNYIRYPQITQIFTERHSTVVGKGGYFTESMGLIGATHMRNAYYVSGPG